MTPDVFPNGTPASRGLHNGEPTCVPPIPKRPIPIKEGEGWYALTADDLLRTRIGHSRGDPQIHVHTFDTLYEAEEAMGIEPLVPDYVDSPQSAQRFQDSEEENDEEIENKNENENENDTGEQEVPGEESEEEDQTRPRLRKGTRRNYELLNTIEINGSDSSGSSSENDEEGEKAENPEQQSGEDESTAETNKSTKNLPEIPSSGRSGRPRTAGLTIRSSASVTNTPEVEPRRSSSTQARGRGRPRGRPRGRGASRQTQRETTPLQPIVISDDELTATTRSTNHPGRHRQSTQEPADNGRGNARGRAGNNRRGKGPGTRGQGDNPARGSTPTPAPTPAPRGSLRRSERRGPDSRWYGSPGRWKI